MAETKENCSRIRVGTKKDYNNTPEKFINWLDTYYRPDSTVNEDMPIIGRHMLSEKLDIKRLGFQGKFSKNRPKVC